MNITSCGEYHKVLNKGTVNEQYALATELYNSQKYRRALQLLEKVTTHFRGKPQMERIMYMMAQSYYNGKDYTLSAYSFDRFTRSYPKSSKIEESSFLRAHSYYLEAPVYGLDQKTTKQAIDAFQEFINKFPDSPKIKEANTHVSNLTQRLEQKSFEIAKQYYYLEDYKAAIVGFNNLITDHLGTIYKEEAIYYKFLSSYHYAIKSFITVRLERIESGLEVSERFKRLYPTSEFIKDIEDKTSILDKEKERVISLQKPTINKETPNGL